MKPLPLFVAALVFVLMLNPTAGYPENFFELTGENYEPIQYTPEDYRELFFVADSLDTNFRVMWFGTNASIPAGWERDVTFDGNFFQGISTDPILTHLGGEHDHNGIHHHSLIDHTHNITGSSTTGSSITRRVNFAGAARSPVTHSHNSVASSAQITSFSCCNMSGTETDLNSAIPPNVTAIIIKPTGAADIPVNAAVFTDENTLTGFQSISDDLNTLFVFAAGIGDDGNAQGGNLFHDHFDPAHNHTTKHRHPDSQVGVSNVSIRGQPDLLSAGTRERSHHLLEGNNRDVDTNNVAVQYDEKEFEPAYTKLQVMENKGGSASTPVGTIAMYVGSVDSISAGWELANGTGSSLFDLTDTQIRITTSLTEIGETGGDNNTFHVSVENHFHDTNTHNFPQGQVTLNNEVGTTPPTTNSFLSDISHSHTWTIANTSADTNTTSVTTTTDDSRHNYREVLFVKKIDSCTYSGSGDFVVQCSDLCVEVVDLDLGGSDLILIGTGVFDINAAIRRVSRVEVDPKICTIHVFVNESGLIEFEQTT